jgi:dTDP-glucose 4,6-dehydratase
LKEIDQDKRYSFIKGDITMRKDVDPALKNADSVVHFAAESHVDRSIEKAEIFIKTNVTGTNVLLECAREHDIAKFVHVSTDEVYGSLGKDGYFTEETPIAANSPYSASKAGSDLLARAYYKTYGFPVIITRCSNNFGPYQFPEKLIPLMICQASQDKPLPVYGDGMNVRDWLYVEDHCAAVDRVLQRGEPGEVYNIGGNNEWHNIDIVKLILKELNKPETLIEFVEDRLGHDRRYAIDSGKIKEKLGWEPSVPFESGINQTIQWYCDHLQWIERINNGQYRMSE